MNFLKVGRNSALAGFLEKIQFAIANSGFVFRKLYSESGALVSFFYACL